MALQSLDIKQRSATTTPSTQVRQTIEVAKLIDVSACIGCKACQVACSEWNDIRDEVGNCHGVYDNPMDLSAKSWTVMRYTEVEQNNKLEWLIRKDGCMHCADPGCLKACPAPGAIIQYSNASSISTRKTALAAATASRVVRSTSRVSPRKTARPTSARCVPTGLPSTRHRPASNPARQVRSSSAARRT